MAASPPVTVILPTHSQASTLPLAVRSVLEQSYGDLGIVIIGDGATPEVAEVAASLRREDSRVSFISRPKSARAGEEYRNELLQTIDSPVIAYQGDDDLWCPDHLDTMLGLLEGRDFVNPLPVRIVDGTLQYLPNDLADPECVSWALQPTIRNAIDLTGVTHTLDSYRRLPYGWRTTPRDRWNDHYMWDQYFRLPGFRGATGGHATTVKFGSVGRDPQRRADAERLLREWWARMHEPGFDRFYHDAVDTAVKAAAIEAVLDRARLADRIPVFFKRGRARRIVDALTGARRR